MPIVLIELRVMSSSVMKEISSAHTGGTDENVTASAIIAASCLLKSCFFKNISPFKIKNAIKYSEITHITHLKYNIISPKMQ